MRCRVCSTTEGPFREHSTTICKDCDSARARSERLSALAASVEALELVVPCEPSLRPEQAYHAMSAITRLVDAIHDNGAVAVIIEPGQVRFRLFAGEMPSWMTDANHRWESLKVADFAPLVDREIDVHGSVHRFGAPQVERLRPCRVLRVVAMQKHNQRKSRQTDTLRRRLLAGGVLCKVVQDGEPYTIQTGGAYVQEQNWTTCTPMRVLCATERDGLVAQIRPLGAGGRFGGGVCVAMSGDHELEIASDGLRTLKQARVELGVDGNTVQYWMRRLGYEWLHQGHGRWFDDALIAKLREAIPSLTWRTRAPRTRHLWTDDEERALWDGVTGRARWNEVADRVGRTRRACYIAAGRLKREAANVA